MRDQGATSRALRATENVPRAATGRAVTRKAMSSAPRVTARVTSRILRATGRAGRARAAASTGQSWASWCLESRAPRSSPVAIPPSNIFRTSAPPQTLNRIYRLVEWPSDNHGLLHCNLTSSSRRTYG
jgi:hypothetical protein